jgi:hypothetical protein
VDVVRAALTAWVGLVVNPGLGNWKPQLMGLGPNAREVEWGQDHGRRLGQADDESRMRSPMGN